MTSALERAYRALLDPMIQGSPESMRPYLHPDLVAHTVSAENSSLGPIGPGPDGFIEYIRRAGETAAYSLWEARQFLEAGNHLVVLGRERFRIHATGREMETAFVHDTKWRDGKLVFWQDVFDSALHRDVWTDAPDPPAPDLPSNVARYRELMRCFSAHDIDGVRALVDPDVISENRAPYNSRISANRHGIKEFLHYMDVAEQTAVYEFLRSHAWLEKGDTVVALGREKFTIKATGRTMETPFVHESRWLNGKLVFWREYYDTAALEDAWIPSPAPKP